MMNAECEGGGNGFYRQVVAQESGNAQAVKRGNFGGKEEMEREKRKKIFRHQGLGRKRFEGRPNKRLTVGYWRHLRCRTVPVCQEFGSIISQKII